MGPTCQFFLPSAATDDPLPPFHLPSGGPHSPAPSRRRIRGRAAGGGGRPAQGAGLAGQE